ncbi:hypothetical protein LPB140_10595 [Sphingorhabdus lutea]|uniref:DNA gyrase inhibitor YacG n=1 Tax=Sphingorhabdus lutea TaxID=1913578 RepID=A0A1L3JDN6_9SPHN|nr:DNA gyrase inhibitor YacG [Sphingorhabdus lutea]APG63163.1 hypothetical protein LPB140_10595 [Sphingorhabdus lutea]
MDKISGTKCPSCRKNSNSEFAPFCSAGCKDRDLLRWLGEGYRIAGERVDPMAMDQFSDDE